MPSDNIKGKYLNWLLLIETDYITMFIKTWFTFLASLHEIIGNSDKRNIGDRQILEEYKSKVFDSISIQIDKEFIKNVLMAYRQAKNSCLNSDVF